MSGESWDHMYKKFNDCAERLLKEGKTERIALGWLVKKVSKAMQKIGWVDSCDRNEGDEIEAINDALGKNGSELKMQALVERAEKVIAELQELIEGNSWQ